MKAKLLFLIFTVLFAFPSFAQKHENSDKESRRKEMMEFKLNFLANEMDLSDSQKKQFSEVYSQMEKERRVMFKQIKHAEKSIADNKNATEADYEKANKEITEARNEMAKIDAKYEEKFSTFLTKKQIYKMKAAESKFMETVRGCRDKKKNEKKK